MNPLTVTSSTYYPNPAWSHACRGSYWWVHFGRQDPLSSPGLQSPFPSVTDMFWFSCSVTRLKWFWMFTLTQITSDYISQGWVKAQLSDGALGVNVKGAPSPQKSLLCICMSFQTSASNSPLVFSSAMLIPGTTRYISKIFFVQKPSHRFWKFLICQNWFSTC